MEVIATGKISSFPGSSKYQIVIEALEPAGLGALMAQLEERKKKLAAEGLFDEAQKETDPVPAQGRRHRDQPDRRRHPRHAARLRRALSDARHRLARARAGRGQRGRGGGCHPRLQCDCPRRPRAVSRRADRRPRRRQPRGPLGLQRRDGRARRGREPAPGHLRRRPRDRLDADRPRRRCARADPDQGRRMGGAQALRARRDDRKAGIALGRRRAPPARGAAPRSEIRRARPAAPRRSRRPPAPASRRLRQSPHLRAARPRPEEPHPLRPGLGAHAEPAGPSSPPRATASTPRARVWDARCKGIRRRITHAQRASPRAFDRPASASASTAAANVWPHSRRARLKPSSTPFATAAVQSKARVSSLPH